MARFSEIMAAVAECIGWPEGTVRQYGRHAREGGFISQGARGNAAPQATPTDVSNLLIALLAGDYAKDAPTIIPIFRQMPAEKYFAGAFPELFDKAPTETLGDILDGIISGAAKGILNECAKSTTSDNPDDNYPRVRFSVLSYPFRRSTISVGGVSTTFYEDRRRILDRRELSDLKVTREVGAYTFLTLGEAMRR
jgi:hypothetical protein